MVSHSKKTKIKNQYIKAIQNYWRMRSLAEDVLDEEEFDDVNREYEVD